MFWRNVGRIFRRELRDQLRDRRTLFMIVVLPILMYPMMGIGILQMSPAFEQNAQEVVLVGGDELPLYPPLLNADGTQFDLSLFDGTNDAQLLTARTIPRAGRDWDRPEDRREYLRASKSKTAVLVVFPAHADEWVTQGAATRKTIVIAVDGANDRSLMAYSRVRSILERWSEQIMAVRLARDGKPLSYGESFQLDLDDVATVVESGGSVWAKLFPFLLVVMSLTGAFYPSIDICAGERERGTMETLLITPASRAEIVLGKFFTVMIASFATALLNLSSMALTGLQLASQFQGLAGTGARRPEAILSAPTFESLGWMIVLLIPMSFFFAAVSLSVASLARSMKEGQYYMTPLYLLTIPLALTAMMPGVDLSPRMSVMPVANMSLLLRELMQGNYVSARIYAIPIILSTFFYGLLALRSAVYLFSREEAMFREADRIDLAAWFRHQRRHPPVIPTSSQMVLCFVLMLSLAWLASLSLPMSVPGLIAGLAIYVLFPSLIIAAGFTAKASRTLRMGRPDWHWFAIGGLLAAAYLPWAQELSAIIQKVMPVSEQVQQMLQGMFKMTSGWPLLLFAVAVMPAFCEEIAFRGFFFSGLSTGKNPHLKAIFGSAILFSLMHLLISLPQQAVNTLILGLLLGVLCWKSGSIWPGAVWHLINNAGAVLLEGIAGSPRFSPLFRDTENRLFHPVVLGLAGALFVGLAIWTMRRRSTPMTTE